MQGSERLVQSLKTAMTADVNQKHKELERCLVFKDQRFTTIYVSILLPKSTYSV